MDFTLFGMIWLPICTFCLFCNLQYLVSLLIYACIFQAASIVNISDKGISPLFITECFFLIKCIVSLNPSNKFNFRNWVKWGVLFTIISSVFAISLPRVFSGINVYPASKGIDDSFLLGGVGLSLGPSNFIQIMLLILNFATLLFLEINRGKIKNKSIKIAFYNSILIVIVVCFWQYMARVIQIIPYPNSFFNSNVSYSQGYNSETITGFARLSSTFIEPSFAGAFLAASFWAIISKKTKRAYFFGFFIFIALVLNLSGTGAFAFLIGGIIYAMLKGMKAIWTVSLFLLIIFLLLMSLNIINIFSEMLNAKFDDNQSGFIRFGADLYTFQLFLKTYGFGVGLGSHRTSGFIPNLLASSGILGFVIFIIYVKSMLQPMFKMRNVSDWGRFIVVFAIVLFVGQIIGLSDLSLPFMWMWMFAAVAYKFPRKPMVLDNDVLIDMKTFHSK